MKISYLVGTPPPELAGTEAVSQEVELLRSHFGGELLHLLGARAARLRLPRALHGWSRRGRLERLDREVDLHHVYGPQLYLYPVLRRLRRPVVYTVLTPVEGGLVVSESAAGRVGAVAVPTEQDAAAIRGLADRVHTVPPGVDLARFPRWPAAPGSEFVLLAGSAPWVRRQFRTKGVESLLRVAAGAPWLRLVFLWRGLLLERLHRLIAAFGVEDRVEILTGRVDVGQLMARIHAAVVLADKAGLVRAVPQSLLEALACGRPVLVSDRIGMAGFVRGAGCGRVVRGVDEGDLALQLAALRAGYETYRAATLELDRDSFSAQRMLRSYARLYSAALSG